MDQGYPKPITVWRGIPDAPQGAFVDKVKGESTEYNLEFHHDVISS